MTPTLPFLIMLLPFSTGLLPRVPFFHRPTSAQARLASSSLPSPESFDGIMTEEEAIGLRAELAATRELVLKLENKLATGQASAQRSRINPRFPTVDYNYGFLSRSVGVYVDSSNAGGDTGPPLGILPLGLRNFKREATEIIRQALGIGAEVIRDPREAAVVDPDYYLKGSFDGSVEGFELIAAGSNPCDELRQELGKLVLSNEAVDEREKVREANGEGVAAPVVLRVPYDLLCGLIDLLFEDRPLARFWFLETVARMPYFSYISMLHLYESLGWWRRSAEIKRVHFAEEWNEFHHLLIMESLGGDQRWSDRFAAQHAAIAYYWILIVLWLFSPSVAYNFSELIEAHAVDTYEEFVSANDEQLRKLPAPAVAVQYYMNSDMFLFDEFQSNRPRGSRRPVVSTLHDVFSNIAADEAEHVSTMQACQDPESIVRSPNNEQLVASVAASLAGVGYLSTTGDGLAAIGELLLLGGGATAAALGEFVEQLVGLSSEMDGALDPSALTDLLTDLSDLLPTIDPSTIESIASALKELLGLI